MPTWNLFQRMLQTPHEDLHKIKSAIESKYSGVREPTELYSVLDKWEESEYSKWLSDQELVADEEVRELLIEEGML